MTPSEILRHHRSLDGRLEHHVCRSSVLGIRKPYYLYRPPGSRPGEDTGLLVLLRGHEREWVNPNEDDSRSSTAIEDLDALIADEAVPPTAVLLPGVCSGDNRIHSCGIDMEGTWPERRTLGSGKFWTYLTDELYPHVEQRVAAPGAHRLLVGFSLGGFTAYLWAVRHPEAFDHVGLYDGTLPWPAHDDPREDGGAFSDPIYTEAGVFDPAFGEGRRRAALRRWNPTDDLREAGSRRLRRLQDTTFWIASAARDGGAGNRDRARFVRRLLQRHDVPTGYGGDVILHEEAAHTYAWADRFLMRTLMGIFGEETREA
jgi:S-formylglutathione hydrolase FrmB